MPDPEPSAGGHTAEERARAGHAQGLANRFALFSSAPGCLVDPTLRNFALIHVDLDDFKSINDEYGHHIGDQALVAFATALRTAVRWETDLVCRVGGDEFVVLLHKLDDPEADELLGSTGAVGRSKIARVTALLEQLREAGLSIALDGYLDAPMVRGVAANVA